MTARLHILVHICIGLRYCTNECNVLMPTHIIAIELSRGWSYDKNLSGMSITGLLELAIC